MLATHPSVLTQAEVVHLPDISWRLKTLSNTTISFESSEKRVAVLNFWATWCPPCLAEMPSFHRLYTQYNDKVDFYLVSYEAPEVLSAFLKKYGYTFPVYMPISTTPGVLSTNVFPTTFVVDKKGDIVIHEKGVAAWDSDIMQELLNTLIAE